MLRWILVKLELHAIGSDIYMAYFTMQRLVAKLELEFELEAPLSLYFFWVWGYMSNRTLD